MYNAIKTITIAAAAALLTACSGDSARTAAADSLLDEARAAAEAKQYPRTLELLDSLDHGYRDCLDIRRRGTRLRITALRDLTMDSIAANDVRLTALQAEVDSARGDFARVDVDGTDGYEVYAPAAKGWSIDRTGVQPRVDADGYFFIAVNLTGRTIGLDRLCAGDSCSLPSQSVAVEGSEIMNVGQEQAAPLMGALLTAHAPLKVTLAGQRGSATITLDDAALRAFAATWRYAAARQQLRLTLIGRERLERQLSRLREQLVNLPDPDADQSEQ